MWLATSVATSGGKATLESSRSVWTLYDVLRTYSVLGITNELSSLRSLRLQFASIQKSRPVSDPNKTTIRSLAKRIMEHCHAIDMRNSYIVAHSLHGELSAPPEIDHSALSVHLWNLETVLMRDLSSRTFLHIEPDRGSYVRTDEAGRIMPYQFSKRVSDAFPSAKVDIAEAAYCLAVDANTATVYHLMCAVEHSLRAIAFDRRVTFPKGPIELQQWGHILRELEKKVVDIGQWSASLVRESAREFYNKALQECRSFNEAYRTHIAHTRKHYDRHEALSVMLHVQAFMEHISAYVAEGKRLPVVWRSMPKSRV